MRCFYHFRRIKWLIQLGYDYYFWEHKDMYCYDYVCVGTASMSDICKVFHVFKVLLSFMRRGGVEIVL